MDNKSSEKIIEDIIDELNRQEVCEYDSSDFLNQTNDWVSYIIAYLGRAADCFRNKNDCEDYRKRLIQVAALCVRAVDSYDRSP